MLAKYQLLHLQYFATAHVRAFDDAAFVARGILCDSGASVRPRVLVLLARYVPHRRDCTNRYRIQRAVANAFVLGVRAVVADFVVDDSDVKVIFVMAKFVGAAPCCVCLHVHRIGTIPSSDAACSVTHGREGCVDRPFELCCLFRSATIVRVACRRNHSESHLFCGGTCQLKHRIQ